jgi:hypothetical protein
VEAQYVAKNFGELLKVKHYNLLYFNKTKFGWSLLRYCLSDRWRRKIRNEEFFLFCRKFYLKHFAASFWNSVEENHILIRSFGSPEGNTNKTIVLSQLIILIFIFESQLWLFFNGNLDHRRVVQGLK